MKKLLLDKSQSKLLDIIKSGSYRTMSNEEIMNAIDVEYSQAIINKLRQLENKGYIRKNENGEYYALKDAVDDVYYFPLIGFAQCGNLGASSLSDISFNDTFAFSTKDLSLSSGEDLKNYFFTRAKGESMLPLIKEDDLVLIKIQRENPRPIDNTLVVHNGKPKIKRVFANPDDTYTLISLNPQFPKMEVSKSDDELEVIGVVRKVISSH